MYYDIVLVSKRNSRAEKIAQINDFALVEYEVERFNDGSSQIRLCQNFQARKIVLYYEFYKPMDLYVADCLRAIKLLHSRGSVVLLAPFMPFLREHSASGLESDSFSLFEGVRVFTLDAHTQRDEITSFQPDFFKDVIADSDLLVFPDCGARRYASLFANEYVVARKDRATGVHFENCSVLDMRNCVILDDIVDTGYTLRATVSALKNCGAASIKACVTHCFLQSVDVQGLDSFYVCDTLVKEARCDAVFDFTRAFYELRSKL